MITTNESNTMWGNRQTIVDINTQKCIWSIIALAVIGPCVFILQPGYVQGLVGYMGFTEEQAGFVASVEMFGLATIAMLVIFFAKSINWRILSTAFLLISAAGNFFSVGVSDVNTLAAMRFFTGLGSGGLISLTFVMMGLTQRAERNIGLIVGTLLTYGAIGLLVMPSAFQQIGMEGVLCFFGLFSLAGLFFVKFLPCSNQTGDDNQSECCSVPRMYRVLALLGMLSYNIAIGVVWVYMFLIGIEAGISEQNVANVLTISQFIGIAGAFTAVVLELRFGRLTPLLVGILGGAAGIALLLGQPSFAYYLMGVCVFNYLWNLATPYLAAMLASYDASGQTLSVGVAMQMLGFAVGPAIAASLVDSGGYDLINKIAICLFIVAFALVVTGVHYQKNHQ